MQKKKFTPFLLLHSEKIGNKETTSPPKPSKYAFSSKPPRKSQEICKLSTNYHKIYKLLTVNSCSLPQQAIVRRSHPAQDGEGFDAPPTLERSGSEHREGAVTSPLPEEEGLGEKVEPSLERGTV